MDMDTVTSICTYRITNICRNKQCNIQVVNGIVNNTKLAIHALGDLTMHLAPL